MKFSRDFINAMDGTGRQFFAFNNVSIKRVYMLQCIMNVHFTVYVFVQIIGTFAPPETWEQCLFTVQWTVQSSEATDCQPHPPANCLLSSARQQSW